MLWQEIREKHPKKWLVIEAKKFHQADDKFVVEDFCLYFKRLKFKLLCRVGKSFFLPTNS